MTNKVWTIIAHEYTSKIKSKGFLIATFLAPLGIVAVYGLLIYLTMSFDQTEKQLYFIDEGQPYLSEILERDPELYAKTTKDIEELKAQVQTGEIDGYVSLPEDLVENGVFSVYTAGGGGTGFISKLKSDVGDVIEQIRIEEAGIDQALLDEIYAPVSLDTNKINEQGEEEDDATEAKSYIGLFFGFVMYFLIFIYGSFVSRGVLEEKANRIVEIIASSAKPIDILLGKIIGIGSLGITQVLMWLGVITITLTFLAGMFEAPDSETIQKTIENQSMGQASAEPVPAEMIDSIIGSIDGTVVFGFFFFFIIGFFIYSAIFAALGAAVDNEQDMQQLQLPFTLPVFISLGLVFPVTQNPDGIHSVILTQFPLTSPILMPARMAATNVPLLEVLSSAVLAILGFLGILWVAAKIYRIGMLSTGKKPSFKDLWKWLRTA